MVVNDQIGKKTFEKKYGGKDCQSVEELASAWIYIKLSKSHQIAAFAFTEPCPFPIFRPLAWSTLFANTHSIQLDTNRPKAFKLIHPSIYLYPSTMRSNFFQLLFVLLTSTAFGSPFNQFPLSSSTSNRGILSSCDASGRKMGKDGFYPGQSPSPPFRSRSSKYILHNLNLEGFEYWPA